MKKIFLFGIILGIVIIAIGSLANINHWKTAQTLINLSIGGLVMVVVCVIGLVLKSLPAARK